MADYEKVKAQIHNLIANANEVMDSNKTNLTDCIGGLISGFGQGEDLSSIVTLIGDGEIIEGNGNVGGSGSGGGNTSSVGLNIHYGETAPEDTSMLWCKCDEPSKMLITNTIPVDGIEIDTLDAVFPIGLSGTSAGVVGDKIYIFGGVYKKNNSNTVSQAIYVFDSKNNTTEQLSVTLDWQSTQGTGVGVVGTKIYLFNGYSPRNVCVFDTENNTIETLTATLPNDFYGAGVGVVGTKIYLFGGRSNAYLNTILEFDTTNNTIVALSTTLPRSCNNIGVGVVGTKIYLFGGYNGAALDAIYMFDTETLAITTLPTTLPVKQYSSVVSVVGTKIYIFGGYASSGNVSTIYVFDTKNNTIETSLTTLSIPRSGIGCGMVGNKIYLLSGSFSTIIEEVTVLTSLESNKMLISPSLEKNIFNILNGEITMELGVNAVYLGNSENQGELVPSYLYKNGAWTQI